MAMARSASVSGPPSAKRARVCNRLFERRWQAGPGGGGLCSWRGRRRGVARQWRRTFQTAVKYPAVNGAASVVMADFNGDGYLDLAVVSNSSGANSSVGAAGAVTVLLGQGDGTFRDAIVYGAGINPPW